MGSLVSLVLFPFCQEKGKRPPMKRKKNLSELDVLRQAPDDNPERIYGGDCFGSLMPRPRNDDERWNLWLLAIGTLLSGLGGDCFGSLMPRPRNDDERWNLRRLAIGTLLSGLGGDCFGSLMPRPRNDDEWWNLQLLARGTLLSGLGDNGRRKRESFCTPFQVTSV